MTFERPAPLHGIYLLTPDREDGARFLAEVAQALATPPALVQYRNKRVAPGERTDQAAAVVALCRAAGVPVVINDDVALALEVGADGVHLGRDDGEIAAARRRLGPGRRLGASCYDDIDLARAAVAAGADSVAFGAVFPSPTKPDAVRVPLSRLREARKALQGTSVGVTAIGGITVENAPQVIEAGADLLAVISDVYEAADPNARIRAYQSLFERRRPRG